MQLVIFTSSDSGRPAMAAAFFNCLSDSSSALAIAAVTDPGLPMSSHVIEAFKDVELGKTLLRPSMLTDELAGWATDLIKVGAESGTFRRDGLHVVEWKIPDPRNVPLSEVKAIRDSIKEHVLAYLGHRDWLRRPRGAEPDRLAP